MSCGWTYEGGGVGGEEGGDCVDGGGGAGGGDGYGEAEGGSGGKRGGHFRFGGAGSVTVVLGVRRISSLEAIGNE